MQKWTNQLICRQISNKTNTKIKIQSGLIKKYSIIIKI